MKKGITFVGLPISHLLIPLSGLLILIISVLATSFQNTPRTTGTLVNIRFRVYVHGEPLQLNKKYKNPFSEIFEISRFRFYIGNIGVGNGKRNPVFRTGSVYHLIDLSDTSSTQMAIAISGDSCNEIQFQLGIDSIDQCQGAQTGALDPVKGMFWTWNSGYQSFRIEGISPESSQPAHLFAYHIGGYRSPYSTIWKIILNPENGVTLSKKDIQFIEIPIEIDYFFNGPTPLRIKKISDCMTPGELSRKVSENFVGSFKGLIFSTNP